MFSCSVYGVDTDGDVSGETKPNPQTAYAICKTLCERDLKPMDNKNFAPCYFRNVTARSRSGWRNICARSRICRRASSGISSQPDSSRLVPLRS